MKTKAKKPKRSSRYELEMQIEALKNALADARKGESEAKTNWGKWEKHFNYEETKWKARIKAEQERWDEMVQLFLRKYEGLEEFLVLHERNIALVNRDAIQKVREAIFEAKRELGWKEGK